jgi:Ca2+-binding RTX toxin-like protein
MLTMISIHQKISLLTKKTYQRARPVARFSWTVLMTLSMLMTSIGVEPTQAAPVGQGFTVTAADLEYILKQIKIAEHHAVLATPADPCAGLLGTGPNQIQSPLIADGLRTIDGSCNNLQPGQAQFGAADQTFPRLTAPAFNPAEITPPGFGPPNPTSYAQTSGLVFDTQPRVISNLIVDQTSTNPAAVAAAGFPVRTQGNPGIVPCDAQNLPLGCVPAGETLFIPNVTTDIGLSPPYNSLFSIFGQFFDHGLDKITNGGNGTVFVPLNADDPLIVGPDGIAGTADDPQPGDPKYVPVSSRFMVLTRGTIAPGTTHEAINTDSPWVDLSQAYTSHPSHQVFLREYIASPSGPQSTGRLLSNADGSMANWGDVKSQTANLLGIQLVDTDVANIPMIKADPYGNFIPGPNGFPQMVTGLGADLVAGTADDVLIEGNPAAPVSTSTAIRINTAFLNDIAHSAGPNGVPDPDSVAGLSLSPAICSPGPSPCYDNELLDLHVIAGDGRANENIGLTSIHTIFEHEHNRLTVDEQNTLNANPALLAMYQDTNCASGCAANVGGQTTFTYGERLFQAARFVTEMEYQHLVFEEFARKVQPAINPFNLFAFSSTATNPAIKAEFAHAVYRFGHSMLDETIPRTNVDGTHNDIALLDGFLNPAAFKDVTPADLAASGGDMGSAGAGAIVMGLSDQVGNELDEFVSNQLRNNLLGLPLDLGALNLTRARSEGIASLNNVRKQIFAETRDGQMTPYTDWVDFGLHIKHPESLINFVAAYGTHPTIVAETTLIGKRNAARAIVNPDILLGDVQPADAADFMFSTGVWANTAGNVSITGLDQVDLWVGGLAEMTNPFGGLLGTTFNYVFELQLTQLQDNDRLYYLNRTPGMNLRAQLEGNSFAELIMRNTTATTLKADSFATADCKFELSNITSPASSGAILGVGSVQDDPASECNENLLLTRTSTGQIKYRPTNSIDPVGINGQSVYNGTASTDRVGGGNDNDTIRGNAGNDILEGNAGDDNTLGGEGNDIITDLAGFDTLKGGPGNDALDGGIGDDLLLGGDGKDLTVGGANTNVHFAGPGDDFILAGQGADAVNGDSGDDWMQGGEQTDLLQGDSGSLFFDDHNQPGNDIMIGQAGDDDYDMEGGDDIGVAGPGIEKNAGAAGFDWSIGMGDPQPQDADLSLPVIGVPLPINQVRDRFNEVEALSGWNFNDILRGDSIIPSQINGGGFIGCDALDQAGLDRIAGLDALVPPLTVPSAPIIAASATNHCPLVGNVWGEGNILLGGGGSDQIEGRGANDIIDGDRYLSVRLSVRSGVDLNGEATGPEIGTTDLLEHQAVAGGNFGAGTTGMTLQQAVFSGLVDVGQIVVVREILNGGQLGDIDTALFSRPQSEYIITVNGDGSVTVAHLAGFGADGTDTLWNMEQLSFCAVPSQLVRGTCDVRAAPVLITPVVTPLAVVSPASLTFAGQPVNTGSAAQVVTLSNTGTANLNITSIFASGDFARTTTCSGVLLPGANCTISVTFIPTAAGARSGTITITDNSGNVAGSTQSVALSGIGLAPIASLSLASLTFDAQFTGTTSAALPVTLSNTGNAALNISSIVASPEFAQTSNCPISLAAGLNCTINVTFTPAATGARTSLLTINHNAAPVFTSTSITLSGTGISPFISLTPASLTFANQNIGSVSAIQTMQLRNIGAVAVTTTSVTVGGPNANQFVVTFPAANCIRTRNAGQAFCTISIRFAPTAASGAGVKNATITVASSGGGTIVANISGTAVAVPTIGALPATLNLGRHALGSTTTTTLTVTNTGSADLHISALNLAGSAAYTAALGTCANPVVAGGTCQITVTFKPTVVGNPITGTLTIVSDASNNPRTVALTGRAP